ncbi:hypothetical protein NQ314_017885 [Rhamnusium bicolor]|uniref:Uncharacterized protein n=1 Tax=Rhamnusium bicolor TaxID=1586634 RepID=A0AAV8WTF0_9CUCU|nr:hypothetical protein NQ314_017885 [Rhamnusium bicolor]
MLILGIFRQYDYGSAGNLKMYRNKSPPLYSFTNMTSPIGLFYAPQDNLCPKKVNFIIYSKNNIV